MSTGREPARPRRDRFRLARGLAALCLALALAAGCAGEGDPQGTYYARSGNGEEVHLTLSEGGKGSWDTDGTDVPLTWETRKGGIWLHTRSGGVLRGEIFGGGEIRIDLPGVGVLTFRQVK